MHVAVPGVAERADAQPVARTRRLDPLDHSRDLRAGHGGVLEQSDTPETRERRQRRPPRLEDAVALRRVLRHDDVQRALRLARLGDACNVAGDALVPTVLAKDEQGARVPPQPDRREVLHRLDARRVEELQRRRQHASAHHSRHRAARRGERGEVREAELRGLRGRHKAHRQLGEHRKRALAAAQQAQDVVARDVLDQLAAGADHLAGGQHGLAAGQVVARDPVLQAPQPPAFSATLPPMVDVVRELGSGG